MKNLIVALIALNLNLLCFAQDFEGYVEYDISYASKNENVSEKNLNILFGTKSVPYYKQGLYKELTNSQLMTFQLFRSDKNKVFWSNSGMEDTLECQSSISKDAIDFTYEIVEHEDTILGAVCNKLIYKDTLGTKIYWYSSNYSLNPDFYKNFTHLNKYEIVKLMRAIYLRVDLVYKDFDVQITATKIKRKRLRKRTFKIPKHKVLLEQTDI